MAQELTTGFDYSSVDKDTAGKLAYYAERGHKLMKASQVHFIAQMGELLSEAQDELSNNRNGTFVKWATTEFDVSQKTVYNYVNAWRRLLCNGYTIYQNLSPTAIYLLTAEDTPKPVQKKVEHLAAQNEPVRRADIQRLIDATKKTTKPAGGSVSGGTHPASGDAATSMTAVVPQQPDRIAKTETAAAGDLSSPAAEGSQQTDAIPVTAAAPNTPASQASIVKDAAGRDVPPQFREAHQLGVQLLSIGRELDRYRQTAKELSELPGGAWIRLQEIDEDIRALKGHFQLARYFTVCVNCSGGGCAKCQKVGWMPEYLKGTVTV